jgi:hypothetical protein
VQRGRGWVLLVLLLLVPLEGRGGRQWVADKGEREGRCTYAKTTSTKPHQSTKTKFYADS